MSAELWKEEECSSEEHEVKLAMLLQRERENVVKADLGVERVGSDGGRGGHFSGQVTTSAFERAIEVFGGSVLRCAVDIDFVLVVCDRWLLKYLG